MNIMTPQPAIFLGRHEPKTRANKNEGKDQGQAGGETQPCTGCGRTSGPGNARQRRLSRRGTGGAETPASALQNGGIAKRCASHARGPLRENEKVYGLAGVDAHLRLRLATARRTGRYLQVIHTSWMSTVRGR